MFQEQQQYRFKTIGPSVTEYVPKTIAAKIFLPSRYQFHDVWIWNRPVYSASSTVPNCRVKGRVDFYEESSIVATMRADWSSGPIPIEMPAGDWNDIESNFSRNSNASMDSGGSQPSMSWPGTVGAVVSPHRVSGKFTSAILTVEEMTNFDAVNTISLLCGLRILSHSFPI